MKRFYLMSLTLGSWAMATACGRLGIGDDSLGDGDASVGDGDGDYGDGDGDGDGDDMGGSGDGDGDGDDVGGSGAGDGDGDGDVEPSFPTCEIKSPTAGARIAFHGQRLVSSGNDTEPVFSGIQFKAEAHDLEDGALPEESILWFLEQEDSEVLLGSGSTLTVEKLPSGEQKILCEVVDSEGNYGYGSVEVVSISPMLYVTHPLSDGGTRPHGQAIEFTAIGFDYEDGTLDATAFTWESDIDGELGTGNGPYSLSLGQHKVTVKGSDSQQNASAASVNVTVAIVVTEPNPEDPLPPIEPEPIPLPPVEE